MFKAILSTGWCGVNLFFVLSGFLITGILLDTKEAENYFRSFYARRILRIFPLYYAVLTAILLLSRTHSFHVLRLYLPNSSEWPLYYSYLSNWHWSDDWNMIGHFWSLAVEEQFYFVWPVLVCFLPRKNILPLSLAGMLASLLLRIVIIAGSGSIPRLFHGTFTVGMDALLAGAAVACIVRDPAIAQLARKWIYLVGSLCLAAVSLSALHARTSVPWGWRAAWVFPCLSVCFAAAVFHTFVSRQNPNGIQRFLRTRVLTSFGKYSYGIYVYHVPILTIALICLSSRLGIGRSASMSFLFSLAVIATSYGVAVISYHAFEVRFLRIKRFFKPRLNTPDSSSTPRSIEVALKA